MRSLVHYIASDYDLSAHRGAVQLDLQAIMLPDAFVDVILSAHVFEHVAGPTQAAAELHRVLRPGGTLLLQVPLPHATTRVPTTPEFHGDSTLVYHRFGWDLRDLLEGVGFQVETLVPEDLIASVTEQRDPGYLGDDVDAADVICGADVNTLTAICTDKEAVQLAFEPSFFFVTFCCRKSG